MTQRPFAILLSTHFPSRNPYINQLASAVRDSGMAAYYFSWKMALVGRYDVLHLHWPESLFTFKGRVPPPLKRAMVRFLLLRLRLTKVPMILTVHNRQPHDDLSRADKRLLEQLESRVTLRLFMNPEGSEEDAASTVIPHGHYRDWHRLSPTAVPFGTPLLLLCGQLRPYKNISELVTAFRATNPLDARLELVGSARPSAYADVLKELAGTDGRINIRNEFLGDEALIAEIQGAALVVLPYPDLYNSGVLFLALSVGRPVLIRMNAEAVRLRKEFGDEWIFTFEGNLTPQHLEQAIDRLRERTPKSDWPDMAARDWKRIGMLHADAYRQARRMLTDRL